jgi:hypothetical protein
MPMLKRKLQPFLIQSRVKEKDQVKVVGPIVIPRITQWVAQAGTESAKIAAE